MGNKNYSSGEKEAIGHGPSVASYSPGIKANGNIFISGQIGIDKNGKLVSDDITEQTIQALTNLQSIINESGSTMNKIVKTTILLSDINDYRKVDQVYKQFFSKEKGVTNFPARAAFAVAALPLGAKVEIEAIAIQ